MKKKRTVGICALWVVVLVSLLTGCAKPEAAPVGENAFWRVTISKASVAATASGKITATQYDGSVTSIDITEMPSENMQLLFVGMIVEKLQPGKSEFAWDTVYIEDGDGNKYFRYPNDTFIESLGLHDDYDGSSAFLAQYLLTPIGDGFEWQWCQHDANILPDADNNPDTLGILLFDNGKARASPRRHWIVSVILNAVKNP